MLDPAKSAWGDIFDLYTARYPSLLAMALDWWSFNYPLLRFVQQVSDGQRILEVGCGEGMQSSLFAMHGYDVTCVDVHEAMLLRTRKLLGSLGLPGTYICADAWDLPIQKPYERAAFDIVFTGGLLEHFSEKDGTALLRELSHYGEMLITNVPTPAGQKGDPQEALDMAPVRKMTAPRLWRMYLDAGLTDIRLRAFGNPGGWRTALRAVLPGAVWHALQVGGNCGCSLVISGRRRYDE